MTREWSGLELRWTLLERRGYSIFETPDGLFRLQYPNGSMCGIRSSAERAWEDGPQLHDEDTFYEIVKAQGWRALIDMLHDGTFHCGIWDRSTRIATGEAATPKGARLGAILHAADLLNSSGKTEGKESR